METLTDIWAEMAERVRRFVARRVKDQHAAEDIAQDVMLKVQTRMGELPGEEKLAAWVFAIARNAIVDHYRAAAVRDHADLAAGEHVVEEEDEQRAAAELGPCVAKMVELLPEPYRAAMKLADLQGVAQADIAEREGISLSGAKSRVQRARQMLKEMVVDCCNVERDVRGNVADYQTTPRTAKYCNPPGGCALRLLINSASFRSVIRLQV